MAVTAVVGSQWGDEAKGKIVDFLAEQADIVARFNGGDNAGHTVVNEFGTFKVRLTPNGFSSPRSQCVIGPGVVVNLATLIEEIDLIQSRGIDLVSRLWVSPRCNVVMPYHPMVEAIYELAKGKAQTGTTGRGMGPVYADKVSYNGILLADLAHPQRFADKLRVQLAIKNSFFKAFVNEPGFSLEPQSSYLAGLDFDAVWREKLEQYARVEQVVREPFGLLQEALAGDGMVLLEGAQGALLDNSWGTYPFCTASTTLAGGATAGLGVSPRAIQHVIGVAKAYTTRVGAGPMPTELLDQKGDTIRSAGGEYGTVTGRPRRCGWFDAELVRFTSQLNGVTELALTKLDVLDSLPVVKICIGYRHLHSLNPDRDETSGGQTSMDEALWHYWQGDAYWLEDCEPVYIECEGWMHATGGARKFDQLPRNAQAYVRNIEQLVGVPITYISVGPRRQETIYMQ